MKDTVEIEFRRILARVHRCGPLETAKYVSNLVRQGTYPIYYPWRLAKYLMKRDEFLSAEILLKTTMRFRDRNPMIEHVYGTWLWSIGEHDKAFRFVTRSVRAYPRSYLFNLLSAMYKLKGDNLNAAKYLAKAASSSVKELADAKRIIS